MVRRIRAKTESVNEPEELAGVEQHGAFAFEAAQHISNSR
jgi:hypothetical protein